jgi:hypothetical protein
MKISDAYPGSYLKAADLQGRAPRVTIADCRMEHFDDESKPLLLFVGKERGLILNKTTAGILVARLGDDTDAWLWRVVELYPDRVMFQGRMVDAIRVRMPAVHQTPPPAAPPAQNPAHAASFQAQAPAAAPPFNDDIPF